MRKRIIFTVIAFAAGCVRAGADAGGICALGGNPRALAVGN